MPIESAPYRKRATRSCAGRRGRRRNSPSPRGSRDPPVAADGEARKPVQQPPEQSAPGGGRLVEPGAPRSGGDAIPNPPPPDPAAGEVSLKTPAVEFGMGGPPAPPMGV